MGSSYGKVDLLAPFKAFFIVKVFFFFTSLMMKNSFIALTRYKDQAWTLCNIEMTPLCQLNKYLLETEFSISSVT